MGMSSCPISSCETYLADYLLEATIKLLLFRYIDICIWKIDIDIYLSIILNTLLKLCLQDIVNEMYTFEFNEIGRSFAFVSTQSM